MSPLWRMAWAAPAGLAANVVLQILLFHLICRPRLLRSVVLGFLLGGLAALGLSLQAALELDLPALEASGQGIANLLTYAALGYGYFHFINLGETARRIRLLRELVEANGALTTEALLQRYNAAGIVEVRLGRLLRNHQVTLRQGRLFLARPTVLWMARLLWAWGLVLGQRQRHP